MKMIFFTVLVLVGLLIGPRVYASGVDSSQPCGSALKVDTAEVFFDASESYTLYAVNSQCFKCSDVFVAYGYSSPTEAEYNASNSCPQLWTPHMWTLKLTDTKGLHVSSLDYTFGSRGRYFVVVDENQQLRVEEIEKPEDVLTPLFSLMGFLAGLTVFVYVADYAWKFFRARKDRDGSKKVLDESMNSPLLSADSSMVDLFVLPHQGAFSSAQKDDKEKPVKPPSNRLGSLDTFRGITLFLMVFVNYGGGHYWFFEHADWNGLTVADLLFPWFMWIMGVSMALSYSNLEKKAIASGISAGQYTWNIWLKAIRRSFVFFAIGMFLNNGNPFYNWRIPGVLQYFAVSYFFAATTVLSMRSQTSKLIEAASSRIHSAIYPEGKSITVNGIVDYFYVLWCYRYEWIIQGVILVVFLSIVFWGKAPGCPVGYNGPGGLSEGSAYWDCTGGMYSMNLHVIIYVFSCLLPLQEFTNISMNNYLVVGTITSEFAFIVKLILLAFNLIFILTFLSYPTCQELYDCGSYDPEGFLGSLSACTLTYLGLIAGRALLHLPSHRDRLVNQ